MTTPYYSDPHVTLYHGDCHDILPSFSQGSVNTIATDPPFAMPAQQYAGRTGWQRCWGETNILARWWGGVLDLALPTLAQNGHALVFCDDESYAVFFPELYKRLANLNSLVWDKGRPGMGTAWRHSHELVIAARGTGAYWVGGAASDVLRARPLPSSARLHPVDKPPGLLAQLIEPCTPQDGVVLDPFAGGGSTLVAAKQLGRRAIGIEIEERYCEIAAQRLTQDALPFGEGA